MNRLALSSRLMAAALITARRCGDSQFSGAGKLSAATENGISLQVIDLVRQKNSVTIRGLGREAPIAESWYRELVAEPDRASPQIIVRLADAVRRIRAGRRLDDARTTALIEAAYGGFVVAIAAHYSVTPAAVRAADPRAATTSNAHWRACAHVRQAAIYLTHTSLGISQRAIARTIGLTEAAVCLAVQAVEDRRDDAAFGRLLDGASRDVTGRLTT